MRTRGRGSFETRGTDLGHVFNESGKDRYCNKHLLVPFDFAGVLVFAHWLGEAYPYLRFDAVIVNSLVGTSSLLKILTMSAKSTNTTSACSRTRKSMHFEQNQATAKTACAREEARDRA